MTELMNKILANTSSDLTFQMACTVMLTALAFGLIISLTYMFTHKDRYQRSFVLTLAMLPVILSVIILFVGSNVARAFSLAGTLSIIRFRSAPGDPEDVGYIFFDIAAGLACGVGLYAYGIVFVVILCLFMILLTKIKFGDRKYAKRILKIVIPENLDYEGIFDEIFARYTKSSNLTKVKTTDLGSLYELQYEVTMADDVNKKDFIDEIRTKNGNLNIVLALAPENIV